MQEDVKFYVVLHDFEQHAINDIGDSENYLYLLRGLKESEIPILYMNNIIPDYFSNIDRFTIHLLDRHPNETTNDIVARYLVDHVN